MKEITTVRIRSNNNDIVRRVKEAIIKSDLQFSSKPNLKFGEVLPILIMTFSEKKLLTKEIFS